MDMLSNEDRVWEKSNKRQGTLQTFIIPTSLHPPYSGALPHWLEGGIERRETYTGAVLGLLFLYRLGKDKIDAPFPRGTGSFEKLKKKETIC